MREVLAGIVADFQAAREQRTPSARPRRATIRPDANAKPRWDMQLTIVTVVIVFCLNFSAMIGRMVRALFG